MYRNSAKDFKISTFRKKILVEDCVLFGDKKDVKLKNVHQEPDTGELIQKFKRYTNAEPGFYDIKILKEKKTGNFFYLIHHQECDVKTILNHILHVDMTEMGNKNILGIYDWCDWSSWGGNYCACHYSESKGKIPVHLYGHTKDKCTYYSEDDCDCDCCDYFQNSVDYPIDNNKKFINDLYFTPISKDKTHKLSQTRLSKSCLRDKWNYGFRLTDPYTNLSYAYSYGDFLVRKIIQEEVKILNKKLLIPMGYFKTR